MKKNLERELSETLIYAISSNDSDNVKNSWCKYIQYIFHEIPTYDKRLFKLNYNCYSEYVISNIPKNF